MSDSDDDLMPESLLKYQHERTGMHTQRPNVNNTHITSFSVRNHNMMTSTFNMPNYERPKYGGGFDQRRMCYRRETSPMSLRSFPDSGMQNFNRSYYPRAMSSQRSVFNGRSGSPMSVRSIDSNASVSAADIALAFKNVKFNKYDLRLIKEAYNKFLKNRVRKRIEKRRNLKLFLKSTKRESGDDSGAQGSDSSISSDDCRSTRTAIYKENLPLSRPKPIRTDITSIRTTIKESNMYEDCTENIKQNTLRNILAVNDQVHIKPTNTINSKPQNGTQFTLKDRFAKRNAFVLPSQRFNKTGPKTTTKIIENQPNPVNNKLTKTNDIECGSENEEIFSEVTVRENVHESTSLERKRNLEIEESNNMSTKRKKLTNSPLKCNNESLVSSSLINTHSDFNFKKPEMPVRRWIKANDITLTEKLISKSAQPMVDDFDLDFSLNQSKQVKNNKDVNNSNQQISQHTSETVNTNNETEISQNTTDVSLRPSFIKRKLYSQKLDVLDKKNLSIENQDSNSPQPKLYAGEKHKVRKLVTSQSCLNRDIIDDNNVLDLIHKIVPPDQMNMTNAKSKKYSKRSQDDDKWDVTSVISMCNNGDVSETYTDEEIFKVDGKSKNDTKKTSDAKNKKDKKSAANKSINKKCNDTPKTQDINKIKVSPCQVVLEKLQPALINTKEMYDQNKKIPNQSKGTVASCVRSFWDTDFESDMEERPQFTWNKLMDGKGHQNNTIANNTLNLNKRNGIRGEILTVRCSQNKGVNSSTRSDISKVSQRKNLNKIDENKDPIVNEKCSKNSQANINSSLIEVKAKRGKPKSIKNDSTPARKVDTKNKETKKRKNEVNHTKKIPNKTRILTPRKVNEKKHQSSPKSNQSSFSCLNISSRSLRSFSRTKRT
ncbi:hypothetical protein KGM_208342 [Danaus plexippus plexippus]|uniref:Uncharacterized protein n=1 Tax=Danaus plexippus plexippus TaxID=278856 RepID=A0A212FJQ4_DANPL|nr:hypothetical protein KGM_208342 [Danaus plexippus plexippus]